MKIIIKTAGKFSGFVLQLEEMLSGFTKWNFGTIDIVPAAGVLDMFNIVNFIPKRSGW